MIFLADGAGMRAQCLQGPVCQASALRLLKAKFETGLPFLKTFFRL